MSGKVTCVMDISYLDTDWGYNLDYCAIIHSSSKLNALILGAVSDVLSYCYFLIRFHFRGGGGVGELL